MLEPLGRPLVTLSFAQTLDGRMATLGGSSQWISGTEALTVTHQLRADHDAIMVGAGTVCADNPRLTVRLVEGRSPLRLVVDSRLRIPLDAALLSGDAARETIIAVTTAAAADKVATARALGARVWMLPADSAGRVDLAALLARLGEKGVGSLMVEGGPTLITALLRDRLADRVTMSIAPKILGLGREAIGDLGVRRLDQALALAEVSWRMCGADLLISGRVAYPPTEHTND